MPSRFPLDFDDDTNLYLVHDYLRLRLAEDYTPGDASIVVEASPLFDRFPPTGIITLTDQCSDIDVRAISFEYTARADFAFTGLTLLPGFEDVAKPKRITNVTQNVMASHHNQLKDALIAIEEFAGTQGETTTTALAGTMEARINYLRKLVLSPKAWFTVTRRVGVQPMTVTFKDFSTRQPTKWTWDFGDGDTTVILRTDTVQTGEVEKTYVTPGIYDVTLQVDNDYGTDTITIPEMIHCRFGAPDEAVIEFDPLSTQTLAGGVLRSRVNQLVKMTVTDDGVPVGDTAQDFTWSLADDLQHAHADTTTASYSIGGLYDVGLKVTTQLGSFRTTKLSGVIDIVERQNICHFIFDTPVSNTSVTKTLYAYEFGLLSETYKAAHVSSALTVTRDPGFLSGAALEAQQTAEFRRNSGFAPRSLVASGDKGTGLLYWAVGAASPSTQQKIRFREFSLFDNTWTTPVLGNGFDTIDRQWNWLSLASASNVYFLFGAPGPGAFSGSPTNQVMNSLNLSSFVITPTTFTTTNYLNGADELMTNVGGGTGGDFSVYRGAWKDTSGYFVRNDGTGSFFRLKSFYRTEGTVSNPVASVRKLTDMPGATKFEGQMLGLSRGLYLFNNTGEVTVYNPTANTWSLVGPGANSSAFAALQDTTVPNYDLPSNPLVAVSDGSSKAYLFFEYSTRANIKFNETDLTFTTLPVRPAGEQFAVGLY